MKIYKYSLVREKVVAEFDGRTSLKSPDIVFQLLQQFYKKVEGEEKEYAVVIHLDTKLKPLSLDIISIGSHQDAPVHPMQVFRKAVISGASSIIFAHNHPSGDLTPSKEDIDCSSVLAQSGNLLGITLIDSIIISGEKYLSLKQEKLI